MYLVHIPNCDHGHIPTPQLSTQPSTSDQIVLFLLQQREFDQARVLAEEIERVAIACCARGVDREDIESRRVLAQRRGEGEGLVLTACKARRGGRRE